MNLLKPYNRLTWKTVLSINLAIFVLGGVFMAQRAVQTPTRTGSKAAAPLVTPLPSPQYPVTAPRITGVQLFYGKSGDTVRLEGVNFGAHQWGSTIANIPNSNIISWTNTIIDFTIPQNLASGPLTITVNNKSDNSPYPLIVYRSSLDPEIVINNNKISVLRAPQNTVFTYTLINEKAPLTLANIESATLKDKNNTLLPLYISPLVDRAGFEPATSSMP